MRHVEAVMKLVARALLTLVAFGAIAIAAADPPYVGKWKFNPAKSTLTGDTVTIENSADGMMQFSSQGYVYKFKLDGKEYPTPEGGTTAWTATSADVWDVTNRMNGKVASTFHLARKDDMLAVSGKAVKPDGSGAEFTASYKRVEGGPGLVGKWMSTEVKPPIAVLDISASGADGVAIKDDTGSAFSGQFDGKDNPAQGRMAGSKYTTAFKKSGANAFEVTTKLSGKPMYVEVYSVSPDGKTLTITGTPSNATQETYKIAMDRQ
jgi:hypothetical protein